MRRVKFNDDEVLVIAMALSKKNIKVPDELLEDGTIDRRYLEYIDSININRCNLDNLDFLIMLPNLKSLSINSSYNYEKVLYYGDYSQFFNKIGDYSAISYLYNLESLSINNSLDLKRLNLSRLSKLKNLELVDNPSLKSIHGLNKLHNLSSILMYGNHITDFEGLNEYLYNTIDAKSNIIDSSILFTSVKSVNDMKQLYNLYLTGLANASFSEKNGQVGYYKLSISMVYELYKILSVFFKKKGFNKLNLNTEDKLDIIYDYIVRNIGYSDSEVNDRARLYYGEIVKKYNGTIPKFYYERFGYMHSSYNTYHFKRGNCEGMVNLMKFMSSMVGIDTEDIHCSDKRGHSTGLNHAILRAKYNGVYSYFDPTYGSLSKHNASFYHNMSFDRACEYLDLSKYDMDLSYKSYCDRLSRLSKVHANNYYKWITDFNDGYYFDDYLDNYLKKKEEKTYAKKWQRNDKYNK